MTARDKHLVGLRWRTGRKVGRTIYAMIFGEPCTADVLIGMMDSPDLARQVVADHNALLMTGDLSPTASPDSPAPQEDLQA
jgi:hypothetical protein